MRTLPAVLLILASLQKPGCGGPTQPTPSPSPSYPQGKANATIFENVALIRSLEAASGRSSSLVLMGGGATQDGRVSSGGSWFYQFGYTTDTFRVVQWSVLPDGKIEYDGDTLGLNVVSSRDIGPVLVADSPEAARLGRLYGGQAYVDRFPQALVGFTYRYRFGVPETIAHFFATGTTSCEIDIYLNFATSALLGHDLTCLNQLP